MAKIKITDLPRDQRIDKEEMKNVMGGFQPQPEPPGLSLFGNQSRNSNLYSNLHRAAEPLLGESG